MMITKKLTVALLAIGLALTAGYAWAAVSDNFESAVLGDVVGQSSGSGWSQAWIGPPIGDTNRAEIRSTEGNQWLRLRFYETSANRTVQRNWDTASFVGAPQISAGLDMIITKTTADMYRQFEMEFMQGSTNVIRLSFNWQGNIIVNLPGGDQVAGKWDVLRDDWRTFLFDIDVANQTWGFSIDGTGYGSGFAFRTPYDPSLPLTGIRFRNGSSNATTSNYIGLDNIWAQPVPEPSSLLALASGFVGLAGVAVRRRR